MSTANAPPPAPNPAEPDVVAAWPRSAQLTTAFLLGGVVTLLGVQLLSYQRFGTRPAELERPIYRIDLNRADRAELLQLPGIGEAMAGRLEAYRQSHGGFRNVDELSEVAGVGAATVERLRPWVYTSDVADEPPPAERKAAPARASRRKLGKKEAALTEPIDVNRAPAAELQRLPGIGPKLAQRILDERQRRHFGSVDELRRVPGIGPKTLEKLRPYVIVQPASDRRITENLP